MIITLSAGCATDGPRILDKPLPALISDLRSNDARTRYNAAFALNQLKPPNPSIVPPLLESLGREREDSTRSMILWALFHAAPDRPEIPRTALDLARRGRTEESRIAGVEILGALGPSAARESVPSLIAALADPVSGQKAAAALGAIGPAARGATADLVRALDVRNSPWPWIPNFAIADALVAIDAPAESAVPALIAAVGGDDLDDEHIIDALGQYGPGAVAALPVLIRILDGTGDIGPRARAARAIGLIGHGGGASITALTRALAAPQHRVQYEAAEALGILGVYDPAAVRALVRALDSEDPDVRVGSAVALGCIATPSDEVLTALARKLGDPVVKKTAEAAMLKIRSRETQQGGISKS